MAFLFVETCVARMFVAEAESMRPAVRIHLDTVHNGGRFGVAGWLILFACCESFLVRR